MRTIRFVFALIVAGLAMLMSAPFASADSLVCDGAIVDTTNAHVLDIGKIQSTVDSFKASHPGTDVYVRAFQNTPGGSGDAFMAQGLQQCVNWRGLGSKSGDPKPNLIMVAFGMDHKSIIVVGENFPAVKPHIDAIRGNDLNANLKSGEFTLAITSSVEALDNAASGRLTSGPVSGSQLSSGPSGESVLKVLAWIGGIVAGIAVLCGVGYGITLYLRHRSELREQEDARLKAQAAARKAKAEAEKQVTSARTDDELNREFLMATGNMPKSMIAKHKKTFDSIDTSCDEQIDLFAQLGQLPATDAEAEQTEDVYRDLERQYASIAATLKMADAAYTKLFADIKEDVVALTPAARKARWTKVNGNVNGLGQGLDLCQQVFDVAPTRAKLTKLQQKVQEAQADLDSVEQAVASYEQLGILEDSYESLANEVENLTSDKLKILDARTQMASLISSRRGALQSLQHVNVDSAVALLGQLETSTDNFIRTNLNPDRSRDNQLRSINQFIEEINRTGRKEADKDAAIEAKKRREREEAAQKKREAEEAERRRRREREEEEERERRRRNDSFSGGFAGGYIGGSIGSSYGSNSSSDSGFSSSSGGWDSGGGGFSSSSGDW